MIANAPKPARTHLRKGASALRGRAPRRESAARRKRICERAPPAVSTSALRVLRKGAVRRRERARAGNPAKGIRPPRTHLHWGPAKRSPPSRRDPRKKAAHRGRARIRRLAKGSPPPQNAPTPGAGHLRRARMSNRGNGFLATSPATCAFDTIFRVPEREQVYHEMPCLQR